MKKYYKKNTNYVPIRIHSYIGQFDVSVSIDVIIIFIITQYI